MAAPLAGRLETLSVQRGAQVKVGDRLFALECQAELAAQQEAAQRLKQAQAQLENLKKGRRPSEIETIEARLAQARAALDLASSEFKRVSRLVEQGIATASDLDRARATLEGDQKQIAAITAELATARLGAREDEIQAAEAGVAQAQAALARADWSVQQKSPSALTSALVHDTLFTPGEWVPAGAPVVSLLPPGQVKVRFFVPQARASQLQPGQEIKVEIDGLEAPLPARISHVSPQVEYTPPVIYNRENRSRLVMMIEAAFASETAAKLHPGQPVDVLLP